MCHELAELIVELPRGGDGVHYVHGHGLSDQLWPSLKLIAVDAIPGSSRKTRWSVPDKDMTLARPPHPPRCDARGNFPTLSCGPHKVPVVVLMQSTHSLKN